MLGSVQLNIGPEGQLCRGIFMIKSVKILIFILSFLVLVPPVFAGVTFTSITYDDTTADVGTSRTVSVAMRTTSSGESATITDISLSGGLTTVSSPQTPFTVTYTPVTKTYTVRSDTADTYSFAITVVDSSGNSYASSSDLGYKTLEYVNPSSLTLTTVESPNGNSYSSSSGSFGIVVRLQNSLSSSQSRNLTLYFSSSGFTVTGDPQTATVTLPSGQTEKIWNVSFSSLSDGTYYAYIRLGDSQQAATYSFTVSSGGGGTTPPGGTTGGAITNVTTGKVTKTYTSITPFTPKKITAADLNASGTHLTEIHIYVQNKVLTVEITIEKLPQQPAEVTINVSGKVYQYINISKKNLNDADIDNRSSMKFKVAKAWIDENNIDEDTIALHRWQNNRWYKLETNKTSADSEYVYYAASVPGFSIFAIAGEQLAALVAPVCGNDICESGEDYTTCPEDCQAPGCVEDWDCGEWDECIEGIQTRSCTDSNDCGTTVNKPAESQSCEVPTGIEPLTYVAVAGIIVFSIVIIVLYFKVLKKKQ